MECTPYLNFKANAEEALKYYHSAIGGELSVMYFKDMPKEEGMPNIPSHLENCLLHGSICKGDKPILMASDIFEDDVLVSGNNNYISLNTDTLEETEKAYKILSAGGKIVMPLAETFWAEKYALFSDKYGINWMINYGNK